MGRWLNASGAKRLDETRGRPRKPGLLEDGPTFSLETITNARLTTETLANVECVVCVDGPGVDGVAVLERVRDQRPGLPFGLVADPATGTVVSRAVAAGISEFVAVESVANRLVARVEAAVRGRRSYGIEESSKADELREADEGRKADEGQAAQEWDVGDGARIGGVEDDVGGSGRKRTEPMRIDSMMADREPHLKERAMDEAPVGITITDPSLPDNQMIYVNDAFERLTWYPKGEASVGTVASSRARSPIRRWYGRCAELASRANPQPWNY